MRVILISLLLWQFHCFADVDFEDVVGELKTYHNIQWEKLFHRPSDKVVIKDSLKKIIDDKSTLDTLEISESWKNHVYERAIIEFGHFATQDGNGSMDESAKEVYNNLLASIDNINSNNSLSIMESLKNTGSSYGAGILMDKIERITEKSSLYNVHNFLDILFIGEGNLEERLKGSDLYTSDLYYPNIEKPYFERSDKKIGKSLDRYMELLDKSIESGSGVDDELVAFLEEKKKKMISLKVAKSYLDSNREERVASLATGDKNRPSRSQGRKEKKRTPSSEVEREQSQNGLLRIAFWFFLVLIVFFIFKKILADR